MENWIKYLLVLLGIGLGLFLYISYLRNKKSQSSQQKKSQQRKKRRSSEDYFKKDFGWGRQKIRKVKQDNYLDYFQNLKRYRKNPGSKNRANREISKLKRLSETGDYPRLKRQLLRFQESSR